MNYGTRQSAPEKKIYQKVYPGYELSKGHTKKSRGQNPQNSLSTIHNVSALKIR